MRIRPARVRGVGVLFLVATVGLGTAPAVQAITWIGGNGDWNDGAGNDSNWNPADEPDSNDSAVFNTNHDIAMGTNNEVASLTMSASSTLDLLGHVLEVNGATTLSGSGTQLLVNGAAASLVGENITINNGSTLHLDGGTVEVSIVGAPTPLVAINAGGTLSGNGTVLVADGAALATTVIDNNGTITASNPSTIIIAPPSAATLSFTATDVDDRIDLDGSLESGAVNITRNQTLDINVQLSDIFNGAMTMSHNTTLDVANAWIFGVGATLTVDNGATGGLGGVAAGKSTIAGNSFAQNSGTITVVDTDGTLQFDAPFSMNGGTLTNNGHVIFNQTATIAAAANFSMVGAADLTVEANRTVTINQTNFNLDGSNTTGTVITVNSGGRLNLSVTDYDSDSVTNAFDGTITVNSGVMSVFSGDAQFVMDGILNLNKTAAAAVEWEGEPLQIGNDVGALDADLNIGGNGNTLFHSQVDFRSDADVDIAAGCGAIFNLTTSFNTVNGGNNAQFTGTGAIRFNGQVNFNEAVTFNMIGGTVDLDGLDTATGNTINVDAPVTVNAATMESFGKVNTAGVNTLDINNSVGTGVLTVNLDNPNAEWTLNSQGVMNLVNDVNEATLLAGNDVNINGTVNVTGDVRTTARLDIGASAVININTAGQPLRLGGGTTVDPNTIAGATISGVGLLGADAGVTLRGFGVINTGIDFDGNSNLFADDGTLTINGAIVDVNAIGTVDADGVLHVANSWNSGVAVSVWNQGGTISGGTITNDASGGILGYGLTSARVINNTRLRAGDPAPHVFQTALNDNDWDGATNSGTLEAANGGTLELRDTGAAFGFHGTVDASANSRVFTSGFALDFNPGSILTLTNGTYESTSSTDFGGTATVGAGAPSTIRVANNFFLTFETGSSTTLNGNLRLENNNIIIEQGATFSGTGALIVPDGSHMVGENLANIGVLLDMQGAIRPGNSEGIGRVDLFDYQNSESSELFVELRGTALNAFDRLVASGDVIVDGFLSIDIDDISPGVPFVPSLGQTFNIITGNTVTGHFDFYDVSGMPAGLAFHVAYLSNAVQLQVVNKESFAADFDDDGDVDQTDYAIWKNAFNLNQLGDATGDNISNAADYTVWRDQLGSVSDGIPGSGGFGMAAVPEPGTMGLVLVGIAAACYSLGRW